MAGMADYTFHRRIEPMMLTVPQLYGNAGEPGWMTMPSRVGSDAPMSFPDSGALGLAVPLAILAMLAPGSANTPGIEQIRRFASGRIKPAADDTSAQIPFGAAFARARRAGLQEFIWRGKRYNTRYREE